MTRVERIGNCTLYLGDCLEVLPKLEGVDAVVTSPPYANQRGYGIGMFDWRNVVSPALAREQFSNAQVLVNLGLVFGNGKVNPYWDGLIADMQRAQFRLFGWYVWDKGFGHPAGDLNRLPAAHEFVFHFNKQSKRPTKFMPTQGRKASGTGVRQWDGTMNGVTSPDKCGQPLKAPDSVLRLPPAQSIYERSEHPAIFPVSFAAHWVNAYSVEGEMVCDPFMGSGTTGVACVKLGRKFIGIEIEPRYFDIACKRIEEATRQPDMFIEQPKVKPNASIATRREH